MADLTEKAIEAVEKIAEKVDDKTFENALAVDEKLNDVAVKATANAAVPNLDLGAMAALEKIGDSVEKALDKQEEPAYLNDPEIGEWIKEHFKPEPTPLPAEKDLLASDLLAEYKELKEKIEKMDKEHLTPEDRKNLVRYAEIKDFLDETRNSLDFVKASTFTINNSERNGFMCQSLLHSKDQYAKLSAALTNGFDDEFIKEVEHTRTQRLETEPLTKQEYLASINTSLRLKEIDEILEPLRRPHTVGEIGDAIDNAKMEMEFNCIDENNVIPTTLELYFSEKEKNRLALLTQESYDNPQPEPPRYIITYKDEEGKEQEIRANEWDTVKNISLALMLESAFDVTITDTHEDKAVTLEADKYMEHYSLEDRLEDHFPITQEDITDVDYENQHKPPKPVEIVESSDGYVMASSEITADNEAEFSSRVNQANNEVVHNEAPQETTIDPSAVGGKVKLEVAEDLGSKELKQIEHGGGAYGSLADRYENSKYDETPDEPDTYDDDEPEQEEQSFGGFDDIV